MINVNSSAVGFTCNPTTLCGQIFEQFLGVSQNFPLFYGDLTNSQQFFWVFQFWYCITHLNPLNEEYTVLDNVKSTIKSAFHFIQTLTNNICLLNDTAFLKETS